METSFRIFDFNVLNEKEQTDSSEDESYKVKKDNSKFVIQMFGINEHGESCSIIVENFKPFFYIKPPETWEKYNDNVFEAKVSELKNIILNDKYTASFNGNKYDKKIIPNNMLSHFSNISIV